MTLDAPLGLLPGGLGGRHRVAAFLYVNGRGLPGSSCAAKQLEGLLRSGALTQGLPGRLALRLGRQLSAARVDVAFTHVVTLVVGGLVLGPAHAGAVACGAPGGRRHGQAGHAC